MHYILVAYNSSSQIGTPLLPNNSVLIREVSFGEGEHHMCSWYLLPRICVLSRGVSPLQGPLREGPLYCELKVQCQFICSYLYIIASTFCIRRSFIMAPMLFTAPCDISRTIHACHPVLSGLQLRRCWTGPESVQFSLHSGCTRYSSKPGSKPA